MCVSLPALAETCFEVNTLGEFVPDRSECSVGQGTEGGGVLPAPATSYSRDLIEYMTADAWSRGLKFLQVNYESLDCDLTLEFFDSWFQ